MPCFEILKDNELPLFRSLSKICTEYKLRKCKLSYSRAKENFKETLKSLGYGTFKFGLHSSRSGGTANVVKNINHNISEKLLKLNCTATGKHIKLKTCMFWRQITVGWLLTD